MFNTKDWVESDLTVELNRSNSNNSCQIRVQRAELDVTFFGLGKSTGAGPTWVLLSRIESSLSRVCTLPSEFSLAGFARWVQPAQVVFVGTKIELSRLRSISFFHWVEPAKHEFFVLNNRAELAQLDFETLEKRRVVPFDTPQIPEKLADASKSSSRAGSGWTRFAHEPEQSRLNSKKMKTNG